jgi:hypothetical protein
MTHALDEPVCTCECHARCGPPPNPDTVTAHHALAAATAVEGADPYPFLIPEPFIPRLLAQARECWKCHRTVRGPMFPIDVDATVRMVGEGCWRTHIAARRRGIDTDPLPLEGAERPWLS